MSEIELISLSSAWTVSDPGYSGFRKTMIEHDRPILIEHGTPILNIKIYLQTFEDILKLNMASN